MANLGHLVMKAILSLSMMIPSVTPTPIIVTLSSVHADMARHLEWVKALDPQMVVFESVYAYAADLPDLLVDRIRASGVAAVVEADVRVNAGPVWLDASGGGGGGDAQKQQQEFAKRQDQQESRFMTQSSPPWNLGRLTSASQTYTGGYVYTAKAGMNTDIYVLDTGIQTTHKDLEGRARFGASFVDASEGTEDVNGHGTHVASIAAGTVYGVSKQSQVIGVKVLGNDGKGQASSVIRGIDWVMQQQQQQQQQANGGNSTRGMRRAVMNLSLGCETTHQALKASIASASAAGIVVVVAAGNNGRNGCSVSPQDAPEAIAVGAINKDNWRATFSNYGSCVAVYAPGQNVTGAYLQNEGIAVASGTSQASPHVAGMIALMLTEEPKMSVEQARKTVQANAARDKIQGLSEGDFNLMLQSVVGADGIERVGSAGHYRIGSGTGWRLLYDTVVSNWI